MKLEELVTDLETSKRLKELGCKQESLFHREGFMVNDKNEPTSWNLTLISEGLFRCDEYCVAAYTLSELIELLGEKNFVMWWCGNWKAGDGGKCGPHYFDDYPSTLCEGKSPLEACANLLIQLLESKSQ